jgi:NADPH:quinone reductase-like Zn-dependent oxidoreductase
MAAISVGASSTNDEDAKEVFPLLPLPDSMRAVVYDRYADTTIRTLSEDMKRVIIVDEKYPLPDVPEDNVLIQVHAASVNQLDVKMFLGNLKVLIKDPPLTPGHDFAGVIVRVGANAKRFRPGDIVYGRTQTRNTGSLAEYVSVPDSFVSKKPAGLSYMQAAALPLVSLAAFQGLRSGELQDGQTVLVLGGTTAVGLAAIQIAKALGASYVACTCSANNSMLAQDCGADRTIDYHSSNWWEDLEHQDIDVILDCVGGYESYERSATVLKPTSGRFITLVGDDTDTNLSTVSNVIETGAKVVNRKFWSLFGYNGYHMLDSSASGEQLDMVRQMVDEEYLRPIIDREFALDQTHGAFAYLASGHARGKVVIAVSDKAREKK